MGSVDATWDREGRHRGSEKPRRGRLTFSGYFYSARILLTLSQLFPFQKLESKTSKVSGTIEFYISFMCMK